MRVVYQIPGVGELTASALVAAVGVFGTFKSGRQFASCVEVARWQMGTEGKTQQLGISKRGDSYLRTLLIVDPRAVIAKSQKTGWMQDLLKRRHCNVLVVALASKIARTGRAVLAKGAEFDLVNWNPVEPIPA